MAGWVIAVLLERPGGPGPVRRYFAIGRAERAEAEWTAVDMAIGLGEQVCASPVGGQEPVEAMAELSPARMKTLGLAAGERRDLGELRPRRWLSR